jgi:predicted DNA-binding transcriptional regulator YafY
MRADRLLSIMLLLQSYRRLTAGELAKRLEVSRRTIYRDLDALSSVGVPIVADRGGGGGCYLLNDAEVQALLLGRPSRLLVDLGLDRAADAAFVKLLAAVPSSTRRDAEHVRQRIHVDPAGWSDSKEDVSALPIVQDGIWQERKLDLIYRRGDGTTVECRVAPLGLIAKGNVWYVVAITEEEIRTCRVSRIQGVDLTDEHFVRPRDFDLARFWESSTAQFRAALPRYFTVLRFAPEALPRVGRGWRYATVEREDPPDQDGRVRALVRFDVEDEAREIVLSLGPFVEVLEPPDLRATIAELAAAIVKRYGATSPPTPLHRRGEG